MADSDGKVIYEVRMDDSQVESDLNKVEKTASSKLEKFASGAKKTGKVVGGSFLAIGTAAVGISAKGVSSAVELDKAMNNLEASTGANKKELEEYEGILKDLYTSGAGESFDDLSNAMATVKQQMGDLDSDSMKSVTQSALTLRDTFGYDVSESVRAANTMMTQFGIDGDKAMGLIAKGAQNGLDFSGELLDSISEYSVQFNKVGLDADDMFKIMEKGAETGAFNLDKIGDAVKEMAIRVVDGSETTAQGFETIGLNADEMSAKFAKGGDSAKEAFNETISALASMEDPLAQNQAGVALFGTMWEDLGPEVVTQLASIQEGAYATAEEMEELNQVKYDDLGSMFEALGRTLEVAILPIGEALIPLLQEILESIFPAIEEHLPVLMEAISGIVEPLLPLVEELLPVALDLFSQIIEPLSGLISEIMPPLIELFQDILPPLMEIVESVLPVLISLFSEILPPLIDIVDAILPPLLEVLNMILEPILELIQTLLPPLSKLLSKLAPLFEALSPIIETLGKMISNTLGTAIDIIMPILENLMDRLGSVIDFITGVFSGDWEKAWDGIVGIFKSTLNIIPSALEGIINGAIGVINNMIQGVNNLTGKIGIPSIPLIPNVSIPRFHTGGIVDFEAGEGPALLQDGEMILTQRQQKMLFDIANGVNPIGAGIGAGNQTVVVQTPVYLDGKLISTNVTQHQYDNVMARRFK